jgi:MULE transposase domain
MAPKKAKKKHKTVPQLLSLSLTSSLPVSVALSKRKPSIHPMSPVPPNTSDINNALQPPLFNNDTITEAITSNNMGSSSPLLCYHYDDDPERKPSPNVMIPPNNIDAPVVHPLDVLPPVDNTTIPGVLLPVRNTTTIVLSDTTEPEHTTVLTTGSTTRNKRIPVRKKKNRTQRAFLDDPTKSAPITIHSNQLNSLEDGNWLDTTLVDYLIQRSVHNDDGDRIIIASSLSLSIMNVFLQQLEEDKIANISSRAQKNLRSIYEYYSFHEFRFFTLVCHNKHFFLISLKFNASDCNKPIFSDVHVYDSIMPVRLGRSSKNIPFAPGSRAAIYLVTLQKFLSTYSFHNSPNNAILINDPHHILKQAKYLSCPQQTNTYDCSLYAIGTFLHVLADLPIDDRIFNYDNISLFRKELLSIMSMDSMLHNVEDPKTSLSREFIISFFPNLYNHYMLIGNAQIEADTYIQIMRTNNDVVPSDNNNNDVITINKDVIPCEDISKDDKNGSESNKVDYYDLDFFNMFLNNKPIYLNLLEVTQHIAKFEKENNIQLKINHSDPSKFYQEYICNSHQNCPFFCRFGPSKREATTIRAKKHIIHHKGPPMSKLSMDGKRKRKQRLKGILKDTLQQVSLVKDDKPIPKDVVKAAANVSGDLFTYNQGYRAIKAEDVEYDRYDMYSFQLVVPYLDQFKELNPGSQVHYTLDNGKLDSVFICPNIMNTSLRFVRPVMSLDATHLKSKYKGTLYAATVKTGLDEIYTVAFSIEKANECYDGWHSFLFHLNNACSILAMEHTMAAYNKHAYFTFISDRDKGLIQALKDIFPNNHSTQCSIHIQRNVQSKFGKPVATDVCNIAKTFSSYQEEKMINKIKSKSAAAFEYLFGDHGIEASKWRSTEWLKQQTLPPRYGITTSNISESANSMFEEAREMPWLQCIDTILDKMSTRISKSREANRSKTGVVPKCGELLQQRWKDSASHSIIKLQDDCERYKVNRKAVNGFITTHVVEVTKSFCTCGLWQEHGIPCVDVMTYYRQIEKKTLKDIMGSEAVNDFHKYCFYHELMEKNINPVIIDNLVSGNEQAPEVVQRQPGRPATKRLRLGRSRFSKPEDSPIICSVCNKRGHNKRSCNA